MPRIAFCCPGAPMQSRPPLLRGAELIEWLQAVSKRVAALEKGLRPPKSSGLADPPDNLTGAGCSQPTTSIAKSELMAKVTGVHRATVSKSFGDVCSAGGLWGTHERVGGVLTMKK